MNNAAIQTLPLPLAGSARPTLKEISTVSQLNLYFTQIDGLSNQRFPLFIDNAGALIEKVESTNESTKTTDYIFYTTTPKTYLDYIIRITPTEKKAYVATGEKVGDKYTYVWIDENEIKGIYEEQQLNANKKFSVPPAGGSRRSSPIGNKKNNSTRRRKQKLRKNKRQSRRK